MKDKIYAAKCSSCGKLSYPTHFYCPACGETAFEPVAVEGEGKLLTFTRAYALPLDYAQMYLTLGIVEMDSGIRATGRLMIEDPKIGMRVYATIGSVREISGEEIPGLIFKEKRND